MELDFVLSGPIPVRIARYYRSTSGARGILGPRWEHSLEASLVFGDETITVHTFPSASISFPRPVLGESVFHRQKTLEAYSLIWAANSLEVTAPNGFRLVFDVGVRERRRIPLSRVIDSRGNKILLAYNHEKRLSAIVDSIGRELRLYYSFDGLLVEIGLFAENGERVPSLVRYEYDRLGQLIAVYGPGQMRPCLYEYSKDSLLTRRVGPSGESHSAIYDQKARCVCTYGNRNFRYRRLQYDDVRKSSLVTNAIGAQTVYRWNDEGAVTEEVDAYGFSKINLIDSAGRHLGQINEDQEAVALTVYDDLSHCLTEYGILGSSTVYALDDQGCLKEFTDGSGAIWAFEWNSAKDPVRVISPTGDIWTFAYAPGTNRIELTNPLGYQSVMDWLNPFTFVENDDVGARLTLRFDVLGRLRSASDALNNTTSYEYSSAGEITGIKNPDETKVSMTYDAVHNLLSETDEEGRVTTYERDTAGNVIGLVDQSGAVLRFTYNNEGDLTTVTNERGENHTLSRDELGRCVAQTYYDGVREEYGYDPCGRLVSFRASDGHSLVVQRESNLVTRVQSTDGLFDEFQYGPTGSPVLLSRNHFQIRIKSDSCGRTVAVEQGDWTLSYRYDAAGRRVGMQDSGGANWTWVLDARGRVARIVDPHKSEHIFEFDQADRLVRHDLPNGLTHYVSYTSRNQVCSERVITPTGHTRLDRRYEYDKSGLRVSMDDASSGHFRYEYSTAGLLSRVFKDGSVVQEYRYDETRNLSKNSSTNMGDRLSRAEDDLFTYDKRGRVATLTRGSRTLNFSYLFDGSLTRVWDNTGWEVSYVYDSNGRRLEKRLPDEGHTFLWDDSVPLIESVQRQGVVERIFYTWLPGSLAPLSVRTPVGLLLLHVDPIGTVDIAWNENGDEVWRWDREGWATNSEAEMKASELGIPFRFPGQFSDPETGLYYNRWRYFIPSACRYLTPDPIRLNGGTNLYWYAPDPYNWSDPMGLQLTIFGTTVQPMASLTNSKAAVYRVDCSQFPQKAQNVCTSAAGPPATKPPIQQRAGGKALHNQCVMDLANGPMTNEPGFKLARINQAQLAIGTVSGLIEKVGRNRPDAWGLSNKKSVYGECDNQKANSEKHAEQICNNEPTAIVYLAVIP